MTKETPGKMYALAIFLTLLAMVAIALRFYTRRMKKAQYSYDDYMILPAMLFTIGTAVCLIVGTALGDMARHTQVDDEDWPIVTHRTVVFEQVVYASQLTQTLTFGFTKFTVLLLYRRIFTGEVFRKVIYVAYALVFIWTVGFFFANLLQCWPISINWTGFGQNPAYCIDNNTMLIAAAWSDMFTDVAILALPLPCIWGLQMKTVHKVGVSAIFLLGLLTVGAGAARLVVFRDVARATDSGAVDITYILTPTVYWPLIESSLGIVGACLPLLRPLFTGAKSKGFVRKLRKVTLPALTYHDPNTSKNSGTTAVASSENSKKNGSRGSSDGNEKHASGATYVNHYNRGLDPHGLLDEKDMTKDAISCTTEIKVSSEGGRNSDDMV
ncbi:hypothetical protein ACLMJK_000877 [Lecanora helva]